MDIEYLKARPKLLKAKKIIDFFGYALFNQNRDISIEDCKNIKSIAVVQMGHIGDLLLSLPMIYQLKTNFNGKIILAVNGNIYNLAKYVKHVDEVMILESFRTIYSYNPRKRSLFGAIKSFRNLRSDVIFESTGNINLITSIYLFSKYKCLVGFNVGGAGFLLNKVLEYPYHQHISKTYSKFLEFLKIPEPEVKKLDFYFNYKFNNLFGFYDYITIAIGAGHKSKDWEDEKFINLIRILSEKNNKVVIVGKIEVKRKEKYNVFSKYKNIVNMLNKTSILEAFSIIKFSKLFIGLDSGLTHAAAMFGIDTIAIYSAMNELEVWKPYDNLAKVHIIRKKVECEHCSIGCENNICMKTIEVDDVLNVLMEEIK